MMYLHKYMVMTQIITQSVMVTAVLMIKWEGKRLTLSNHISIQWKIWRLNHPGANSSSFVINQ